MNRRRKSTPRTKRAKKAEQKTPEIMAAKFKAARPKPPPKFETALRPLPTLDFFRRLDLQELNQIAASIRRHVHWSIGEPTQAKLREIESESHVLRQLIDFEAVVRRLSTLHKFEQTTFGVSLSQFFPELDSVYESARDAICAHPKSIEKAEAWLAPIAKEAGADADLEAAIYFASRGRQNVDSSELREIWLKTLCYDIVRGKPVGKIPRDLLERAKNFTISVSEAADVLESHGSLNRFFGFRDEEEDFIDATLFRAVEWLSITGYERWLHSLAADLSAGPQYGIDHMRAGFWLFYWCRSNLALRMVEQQGLDSWLWGLVNGPHTRSEPWKVFDSSREKPRFRDYIPLTGILPFVWHRIKPSGINDAVVTSACDVLLETQANDGGWPLYRDESSQCFLSTCMAIHGLAAAQPQGWQQAARKGAEWLLSQQEDGGHWHIGGGPTVMLTVLALDSIALANNEPTTFAAPTARVQTTRSTKVTPPDYSRESWNIAALPKIQKVGLKDSAKKHFRPKLGIVVATKTELTAALKLFKPATTLRRVWQVSHANETYYLGTFGTFDAVLMLCSMGTQGASGSTLASDALIQTWNPQVILLAGIAFGVDKRKQKPGDVLVAQSIIPYESQRVGKKLIFRNPIPPASDILINRFKNVLDWSFPRPDGTLCEVHFGPVLSGEKLIDEKNAKRHLTENFPAAIGGEMEGAGLWAAATRSRKEWLVVKAVCDWAENKDKQYQPLAAASAMSICEHVFQNPHALDGLP